MTQTRFSFAGVYASEKSTSATNSSRFSSPCAAELAGEQVFLYRSTLPIRQLFHRILIESLFRQVTSAYVHTRTSFGGESGHRSRNSLTLAANNLTPRVRGSVGLSHKNLADGANSQFFLRELPKGALGVTSEDEIASPSGSFRRKSAPWLCSCK